MNKIINLLFIALFTSCAATNKLGEAEIQNGKQKELKEQASLAYFVDGAINKLKGEYAEAIVDYEKASELNPNAGIYYELGKIYYLTNQKVLSLKNSKKAVELEPTNVDYNMLLAQIFLSAKLPDSAEVLYNKIISIDTSNIEARYNLASLYEVNKPIQALEMYKKIMKITGAEWNILLKVATLNERLGNVEETITTIENLVEYNPSNINVKKLLISSYIKSGKIDKALNLIKDVLQNHPYDIDLLEYRAECYLTLGEWQKGAELYEPILQNKEVSFDSKLHIGLIFFNQAINDSTIIPFAENILKIIDRDSSDWQVKTYLGELFHAQKNDSIGIKYFREASYLSEWNVNLWRRLGGVLFDSGRYDEAIAEMKKAVGKFPNDFVINIVLGLSYLQNKKSNLAKQFLEKSIQLNPYDFTAQMAYGFVLNGLKEKDKAIIHLNKALEINPNSAQVLGTLGMIYDDKEMWDKCFEMYEKALSIDSNDVGILNNYAYSLSKNDIDLEEAYKMSEKTIQKEPDNSSYLDTFGWINYKLGDYNAAKEYIFRAYQIDKKSSVVIDHLGDVYLKCGDIENALKYWKEALSKDKNKKKIEIKIKRLESEK